MSTQNGDDSSSSKSSSDPISTQTKQKPTDPDFINLKKAFDSVLKEVESCYVNWEVVNLLDRLHGHVERDETIFHLALRQNHTRDLEEVVNNKYTEPQYLEIPNHDGNPAFHVAAMTGKWEFMRIMMNKNPNLPLIHGQDEMLPIHLAVLGSHRQIVNNLYTYDLLEKMSIKDIGQLFFMAFKNNMYHVACNLTHTNDMKLIVLRDDDELTALHMLARKPPSEKNKDLQRKMILNLRRRFHWLEYKEKLKLRTEPSVVVFDAIKSGNIHFLEVFLSKRGHPDYNSETKLWELKDPNNGQNLLHIAVWFRQKSIMNFILDSWESKHIVIQEVDKDSNNVLHFAARQLQETSASLRPDIQMQRELEWFEEVKKRVPPGLNTMKNKDGKTPMDMFHAHHTNLSSEIKDTAKKVAESGMVVAALVVTVAFSAALTTPGDKTSVWFTVFIMANAVALFTSSLSIVAFLSIYTSSRFTEGDFIATLYPSLIIGKGLLFISLVTMMIAFAAASFLIFGHNYKWVAYVVTTLGLLTIIFVLGLQLGLVNVLQVGTNKLASRISNLLVRMREKFRKFKRTDLPVSDHRHY